MNNFVTKYQIKYKAAVLQGLQFQLIGNTSLCRFFFVPVIRSVVPIFETSSSLVQENDIVLVTF